MNVIGVPKTIDNDVACTEITFGHNTAVSVATDALDRLHTTGETHHRIMVLEVMGRYAGWIALESAIAGGADIALIPEIPYDLEKTVKKIQERAKVGKRFSIIVVAEGATPKGGTLSIEKIRDNGEGVDNTKLGGAGEFVTKQLAKLTGFESRCTVLGYMQRGGTPTAYDRILSTKYGAKAMELALEGKFGTIAVIKNGKLGLVVIQIGEDPASCVYVNQKQKMAEKVGYDFYHIKLDEDVSEKEVLDLIDSFNEDPVCGYVGIIKDVCPRCGRKTGEPVSVDLLKRLEGKDN